jgi:2-polyprenyl-3-methyl-5-hydroxy-6-metoxy-1,4-benzoquinol methylase
MTTDQYSGKAEYYFESQRKEMLTFIPKNVKKLLEIGCGTGAFSANLKTQRNIIVTGIEPQHRSFLQASTVLDKVLPLDVDAGIEALSGEYFDCVVFNDVLEHLIDPWSALMKVSALLSPRGCVVASIPNIRHMPTFKEFVINGEWEYQKDGVLDKTHLRFFTKKSISILFETSGYTINTLEGINGLDFPWKYSLLNKITRGRLEDTKYKQYACVAIPKPKTSYL